MEFRLILIPALQETYQYATTIYFSSAYMKSPLAPLSQRGVGGYRFGPGRVRSERYGDDSYGEGRYNGWRQAERASEKLLGSLHLQALLIRSKSMRWCGSSSFCRETLDRYYAVYNRPEFIHPDPLEFVHRYRDPLDREVAGMVASALAYGRVQQILKSVSEVLHRMGESPSRFLWENPPAVIRKTFVDFRHRFTSGAQLAALLCGIKGLMREYGSMRAAFAAKCRPRDETILPGLTAFVRELHHEAREELSMLLPSPLKGSACKRLNLFLRWMVRSDGVDPGGWNEVGAHRLIVPLDTHMHRIGLAAGITRRRQADLQAALEVTRAFAGINPDDPVRYDFALTRPGIRGISG